jgi:hypothetical protein
MARTYRRSALKSVGIGHIEAEADPLRHTGSAKVHATLSGALVAPPLALYRAELFFIKTLLLGL